MWYLAHNYIDAPHSILLRVVTKSITWASFAPQQQICSLQKYFFNNVLSTKRARCAIMDIKDFYLNNPLPRKECMKLAMKLIPNKIIQQYNLLPLVHDGYIYIEISKGMYGLPQAGKIANKALEQHLKTFGYSPCPLTPGLWKHHTRPVTFALVVDDFAIKCVGKENM